MDRRRFLGVNAASAASFVAGAVTDSPMRVAERRPDEMPADMDAYLARLDDGMSRLSSWSSAERFPGFTGDHARTDALVRAAFQSIYLTGMVGDLPTDGQLHDGMQARLQDAMPAMDLAAEGMAAFLGSRTTAELAIVQTALREHDAGPRILELIDREAEAIGLSSWRRAQTRSLFASVEWRLRNQPPALVVAETVTKVERLLDADARSEAEAQALAARAAEAAFWAALPDKRQRRISRGARTMGWGVLVFAGGAAIVAAGGVVGLFIGTAGVVMVLVGLIILLVGLATPSEKPARQDSTITAPAR